MSEYLNADVGVCAFLIMLTFGILFGRKLVP